MTKIFHNPRCSKSRASLALLNEQGIDPEIVLYLNGVSQAQLEKITKALDVSIFDIIRKKEAIYQTLGLTDKSISEQEMMALVTEHPILLERPIILHNNKAVIGRPPENVLTLFQ